MKIAIAGCEHDTFDQELAIAEREGVELQYAYRHTFTPEEILERCQDADAILSERAFFGRRTMERLPKLVAIGRYGAMVSGLDVRAANERQIAIFSVPDASTEAVSDHALTLALMLLRDVAFQDRRVRLGDASFVRSRPLHLFSELTYGVLGCGRIGSSVARKAQALGFEVLVSDAHVRQDTYNGFQAVDFEDLLARCDVLSVHLPRGGSTFHLIGRTALKLMKPSAIIVNTGDGDVVDLRALSTALQEGRLRAAGLDTLDEEPMPTDAASLCLDRLVLTPHMAWYTEETLDVVKRRTIQNVIDYLKGRPLHDMLNPQILTGETVWPVERLHIEVGPLPPTIDPTLGGMPGPLIPGPKRR